jgi:hypothetical protein
VFRVRLDGMGGEAVRVGWGGVRGRGVSWGWGMVSPGEAEGSGEGGGEMGQGVDGWSFKVLY